MKSYLYVAIGGFCGALVRYSIASTLSFSQPLIIIGINIVGSFMLALLYTCTAHLWRWTSQIRLLIGTGFLGAFTTFSTFSLDIVKLLQGSHYVQALIYIVISIVGGGVAAGLGVLYGNKISRK